MVKNRALRRVCRLIALTAMPVLLLTIVVGCPFLDFLNPPPACDPACGDGESCVDGVCEPDVPACDPACEDGESCVDGACVPDAPAACDPECGEGESCEDGACVPDGI